MRFATIVSYAALFLVLLSRDPVFVAVAQELGQQTPSQSDIDRLQGNWLLVSAERNGKRIERSNAKPFILTVSDHVLASNRFPDNRYKYRLDTSRKPWQIDKFLPVLKKWQFGIYEIKQNRLRLCWASSDKPRPDAFVTTVGDSRLLQEFRKHSDRD